MADVAGIGGADFSPAKSGLSTEESGRLNRSPREREDVRAEDTTTTPARGEAVQAEQRTAQSSPQQDDGNAQRNTASTGDFTAGGTDRQGDTVTISAEARNVVAADRSDEPALSARPGAPADAGATAVQGVGQTTAEAAEPAVGRDSTARTRAAAETGETARNAAAPAPGAASPVASAAEARDAAEVEGPDRTNQSVRNENSNAEVSGGEADQSEQTRTIGQVVDVFA